MRNFTNTAIKHEKRAYINFALSNEKSSNVLYKELNKLNIYTNPKRNSPEIPDHLNDLEAINRYFVQSTFSNLVPNQDIINNLLEDSDNFAREFDFTTVDENEILKALSSIKSTAVGSDGIGIHMLQYCCPFIIPFITHIINCAIEINTFPKQWKIAHVLPLPKTKNPDSLKELRPISILPTLSKVAEKILFWQIKSHCDMYSSIPVNQSGFRSAHSCSTALLKITDDILQATDNNLLTVLVLLDYSKAFDRLNHDLLLAVLKNIDFSEKALNMVGSYLGDREQIVKLNDKFSSTLTVSNGVPQGSILGPLFFILYTAHFKNCLNYCTYHCYADDTQIYMSFAESQLQQAIDKINSDLSAIYNMSQKYCLTINPTKSQIILFGPKNVRKRCSDKLIFYLNNEPLSFSETVKNLGLNIDSNLTFDKHVNYIISKSYSSLKLIYNNSTLLNFKVKKVLCEALVLSHLNFLDVVYGPCLTKYNCKRLQMIQNSCVRFLFGLKRRQAVSDKLHRLSWLNTSQRRFLHYSCLCYNIIKHQIPKYLFRKLTLRSNMHNFNMRITHLATIPRHRTTFFEKCFTYTASKVLNKIMHFVISTRRSTLSIKNNLKSALLNESILYKFKI